MDDFKATGNIGEMSAEEQKLLDLFRQLNQEGREKAIDQLDTMVLTGKYLPGTARLSWLQKRQGKEVRT